MTVLQKLYTCESWNVTGDHLGTVYHGGKRKITRIDASRLQSRDHGFYGKGFYVTNSKAHARTYGQRVSAFKVHPKAKVLVSHLNPAEAHPELVSAVKQHYFDSGREAASRRGKLEGHRAETEAITGSPSSWHHAVTKYAHDKNYDVVKHSNGEITVRNPNVLSHVKESVCEIDVSGEARDKAGKWTAGGPHPSRMHAKHINAELDALDDERSAHVDRMIAAGRGHERADETYKKAKTDPNDGLAQQHKKLSDRHHELRSEIETRYGPNPPRRLPTHKRGQFGPRIKESVQEEDSFADFYDRTSHKNRKGIERAVAKERAANTKKDLGGVREFGKGGKAFGGEKEGLLSRLKSRLRDAIGAHRASRELARKAAQDRDTRPATSSAAHRTTGKFHLDQSRKALAASKSAFQHHDKGGQRAVMLHRTAATLNYSAADASKQAMDDKLHQHHSKLHVTHRRAMKELRSSEGSERKPSAPRSSPEDFAGQQSDKATKTYHETFRAHRSGGLKDHSLIKQHRKAMALHRSAHDELKNAGDNKKAEHHRRMYGEHRHAIEKLRGAKSMSESANEASDIEHDAQTGRELTTAARAATKAAREARGKENKYRAHTDAYDSHREAYKHHMSIGNKKFAAAHKRLARAHKERVHKYGPRGWYESVDEAGNDDSRDLRRLSSVAYKMSKHAHKVDTHASHLRAANAHDRAYSRLQNKNKKAAYEHRSMADTHYSILSRKMSESIEEESHESAPSKNAVSTLMTLRRTAAAATELAQQSHSRKAHAEARRAHAAVINHMIVNHMHHSKKAHKMLDHHQGWHGHHDMGSRHDLSESIEEAEVGSNLRTRLYHMALQHSMQAHGAAEGSPIKAKLHNKAFRLAKAAYDHGLRRGVKHEQMKHITALMDKHAEIMQESIEEDLPHTNAAIGHSSIAHDASARARKSNKPADHKTAIRLHFRAAESHKLAASKSTPGTASHAYHLDHAAEHDTHVKDHRQVLKGMGAMAHESSLVLLRLYESGTELTEAQAHQQAWGSGHGMRAWHERRNRITKESIEEGALGTSPSDHAELATRLAKSGGKDAHAKAAKAHLQAHLASRRLAASTEGAQADYHEAVSNYHYHMHREHSKAAGIKASESSGDLLSRLYEASENPATGVPDRIPKTNRDVKSDEYDDAFDPQDDLFDDETDDFTEEPEENDELGEPHQNGFGKEKSKKYTESIEEAESESHVLSLDHPAYTTGHKFSKVSGKHSPLSTHGGHRALKKNLPNWTKEQHRKASAHHASMAAKKQGEWNDVQHEAHKATFGHAPRFDDYKVSGVGRSEYSDGHKSRLRALAREVTAHRALYHAHRQLGGSLKHAAESIEEADADENYHSLASRAHSMSLGGLERAARRSWTR